MNIYFGVSKVFGVFPWITQRVSKLWLIYSFISNIICASLVFSVVIGIVCKKNTSVGMLYVKVVVVLGSSVFFIPLLHWLRIVFHPKAEFVLKTVSLTPVSRAHACQISFTLILRIVFIARLWIAYKQVEFTIVRTLLPFAVTHMMFSAQLIMSQFLFTIIDLKGEIVSCAHKLRTSPLVALRNHETISTTVLTIFQFYSPQIFLLFVSATSNYSLIIHELLISKAGFDMFVYGIDSLCLLFQIVAYCENYQKTDNDFYEKLFQTLLRRNDCRSNPKMLLYLKTKARISFTACGFLTLKYSLFASIIAIVTTYFAILNYVD